MLMAKTPRNQEETFGNASAKSKSKSKANIRRSRGDRRRYSRNRQAPPSGSGKKSGLRETWKSLNQGWKGTLLYVFLGVALALLTKQALAVGLGSEMPVVAVVSPSMQHDNAMETHYSWLSERLGYSKDYIDSWTVPTGFMIGDMPIVKGEDGYKVGDVIVYSVPGQKFPIIHRVIKVNDDGTYQTKGDNNIDQLPYEFRVSEEQIYGKVVFVIPKLGYFKVILTKALGNV